MKAKNIIALCFIIILFFSLSGCKEKNENIMNKNINSKTASVYLDKVETVTQYEIETDGEVTPEKLLQCIGDLIGYKIETNKITLEGNKMTINFKSTSAPFDDSNTYIGNGEEQEHIYDYETLVYVIFDSIQTTLQKNYGEDLEIYYNVDKKEIKLDRILPELIIKLNEPYKGSEYYIYRKNGA